MKNWRKQAILTTLAVLAIALPQPGCKKPQDNSSGAADKIKIGEYASLTGTEATFGQSSHHGTELAVDEINAAGGVLGKQIELIYEDNQSKAGESAAIVQKFISRDNVVAV